MTVAGESWWRERPAHKIALAYLLFSLVFGVVFPWWLCRHYHIPRIPLDFYKMTTPNTPFIAGGDFVASYAAANAVRAGLSIYENHADRGPLFTDPYAVGPNSRYSYPPLQAYLLTPITNQPFEASYRAWCIATIALLIVSLFLVSRCFAAPWLAFVCAFLIYAQSTFLLFQLERGQTDALLILCIAAMVWLFLKRRSPIGAGIALACGIMLKVIPALFILFFLLRREWRVLVAAAVTATLIGLATEPRTWIHWLLDVMPAFSRGTFIGNNVDHSLVYLFEGITHNLESARFAARLTFIALVVIYAALVMLNRDRQRHVLIEIVLLSTIMEIATPWAINYKLVVMAFFFLAPFAILSSDRVRERPLRYSAPLFLAFVAIVPFYSEYLSRLPFSLLANVMHGSIIVSNPLDPFVTDRRVIVAVLFAFLWLLYLYATTAFDSRPELRDRLLAASPAPIRLIGPSRLLLLIIAIYAFDVFAHTREALAVARIRAKAAIQAGGEPRRVNDTMSIAGYTLTPTGGTRYEIEIIFKVAQPLPQNLHIFFHARHRNERGELEVAGRNFQPSLITSLWPAGKYVVAATDLHLLPGPCEFRAGLFSLTDGAVYGEGVIGNVYVPPPPK